MDIYVTLASLLNPGRFDIPTEEGVEKRFFTVMPAKAGIQYHRKRLDSGSSTE